LKVVEYTPKKGIVKVVPEDLDDLWILYNVIRKGDRVYSRTSRTVKVSVEGTRPDRGKRVPMLVGLRVAKVSFHRESDRLRVHGLITAAPEKYEIQGRRHTLSVVVDRPLTIVKDKWLKHDFQRLKEASQGERTPIIVVSLDDQECCVAYLRRRGIDVKASIQARLPGKREAAARDAALSRYFSSVLRQLLEEWTREFGLITIVGPGFLKERLRRYISEKNPEVSKRIRAVRTVPSGGVTGVEQTVRSGVLAKVIREVRIIEESKAVGEVLARLGSQRGGVSYGMDDVARVVAIAAVELLLVTDELLREGSDEERQVVESLMRKAEVYGGKVMIVTVGHDAGRQLKGLGGIAALLRYPVA
jgi:protein pelota